MLTRKLYGPPGTGKTRALTGLAIKAAQLYGPTRIAALTYTRAAADELKGRIAAALGLNPPVQPWQRKRYFDQRLPWVGTIHSLALRLLDRQPVLGGKDLTAFIRGMGGTPSIEGYEPEDAEGYTWAEPGRDEVEAALSVYSMARHRLIDLDQAYAEAQWGYRGPTVSPERVAYVVKQYEQYKRDVGKIDFEDMLEQGLKCELPVDAVLADEVQDNSPLLWLVLDNWTRDRLNALAGDPYQALYIWSGAEPSLFIDHDGQLHRLGNSHRLTSEASLYAQGVLQRGGHSDDEWLGSWGGLGKGQPTDGSQFYLARTGRLLVEVRRNLEYDGVPYANLRGGGPLASNEAAAYRILARLREVGWEYVGGVAFLAQHNDWVSKKLAAELKRMAREDEHQTLDAAQASHYLGGLDIARMHEGFKRGDYLQRVYANCGMQGLVAEPLIKVGTIHSAKGREADYVTLIDSWGTLPFRSLSSPAGARAEACVAYVGLTRHRVACTLTAGSEGSPYPF